MIKLMKKTFYHEKEVKEKLCAFIKKTEILSMGEKCKEFEEKFAKYQGRKYAVYFNSGSSANLAMIQALLNLGRLKKGDNVGFSALTWPTDVSPLIQLGLNPIPIDISKKNLNINSENILNLKENLKAILLTNLLGFCGDINKIKELCEKKGILLLEDNCESLGSEVNNIKLGNFGLGSSFSFFVGHQLSTIEGGLVCTDDKEFYNMLIMVRAHGWVRNLDKVEQEKMKNKHGLNDFFNLYSSYYLSYNLRPTEINGFIGIEQLKYIDEIIQKRFNNFKNYETAVANNSCLEKLDLTHMNFIANFAYPLLFKNKESFEKYRKKFKKVEIRPLVGEILKQPFFENKEYSCPNAEKAYALGFYLPNNPNLTEKEIDYITKLIQEDEN